MAMQVILTQDVDNLGKAGELVSVRPGYGRNYLVPRGLAVSATVRNKNRLDHEKALIEKRYDNIPDPDTAIASLDAPNDNRVVGGWIRNFLEA